MPRIGHWLNKRSRRYAQSFSFIGLVAATLFFAASVTPSLLPRHYAMQGLLSGFSIAVGYGIGVAAVWLWVFLELRQPGERLTNISKRVTVAGVAIVFVWFLWQMTFWQNTIRERMEMPAVETAYPYRMGLIAAVSAAILVFLGRVFVVLCAFASRQLNKYLPRRIANAVGFVVVALVIMLLFNDIIAKRALYSADKLFEHMDGLSDDGVAPPSDARMSGSSESLVSWDTIGRRGKNFIVGGPARDEIAEFAGDDARAPIRVYVGLRSRPTAAMRAKLALDELVRAGAFDRKLLVVATPTGTGWLDPNAVDTVEYLHGGDTAIVSIQYSYLPSWLTILVDPTLSREAAHALFDEVYGYWKTLPKGSRPKLYLHGLSLGAMGSETSADLYTIFEDPIQGAVWSGTPFPSRQWKELVRNRNQGTPVWLPKYRDGSMVRFINQHQHFDDDQRWGSMRNVYIQYASDPMVWFSPDLAFHRPSWLSGQRGSDVSPYLRWYPIVTFLQIGFDLPMATSVPLGFAHNYSPASYIDAWIAVTEPEGWDDRDSDRLKELFADRTPPTL